MFQQMWLLVFSNMISNSFYNPSTCFTEIVFRTGWFRGFCIINKIVFMSLIWNLVYNFWPVYEMRVFKLVGSTFLSVLLIFLIIVVPLEPGKGNSNERTLRSCGLACSVILIWVTFFCFWLSPNSFITCFIIH